MLENEKDWRLAANTQYHEAMKIVVNLATASLVLPTVLIEKIYRAHPLDKWAYRSWALLFFSIFLCMLFFYASAKYVKVVSGGSETPTWPLGSVYDCFHKPKGKSTDSTNDEEQKRSISVYEAIRDGAIFFSILSFMAGLVCLGLFALD
jgi:hypothetical protein